MSTQVVDRGRPPQSQFKLFLYLSRLRGPQLCVYIVLEHQFFCNPIENRLSYVHTESIEYRQVYVSMNRTGF